MVATKLRNELLKLGLFFIKNAYYSLSPGTTPQRKTYTYPRFLAATSPHERILQRYRAELAVNTTIALSLPLDSSFNVSYLYCILLFYFMHSSKGSF